MKQIRYFIIALFFAAAPLFSDGLLVPTAEDYPHDFLRNRLTHVTVKIHGLIAETQVYQEFQNDWDQSVDAVYSFPLPPDARATQFLYWANDKVYRAVLKVREQAGTPGTGEGGIIAEVNKYIGRNGIKVALKNIPAGQVQKVKLYYVSKCDYFAGETTYHFPLETSRFVTHPLEHVQFSVIANTSSPIVAYECPSHPDYMLLKENSNHLHLEILQPKAYLAKDFEFSFQTEQETLGLDFYAVANDSMDGHFVLNVRPQNSAGASDVFPQRVIFLISNSSNMFGYKLDQCVQAIKSSLGLLAETDVFNIIVYNNYVSAWQSAPVTASSANIEAAEQFMNSITSAWGSRMDLALDAALRQITDEAFTNSIVVLSDGRCPLDPRTIETKNTHKAGIFPIGIGGDVDYLRLEMLAALNYGFTTYFDDEDNLFAGIERFFQKISQPIMKEVSMEFGRADLHDVLPSKIPAAYAGSCFALAGRYANPSESGLAIAGQSVSGTTSFDFRLDFSDETTINKFAESIWAKEKIDELEREIEIYGETVELREQLIALSLQYNIRCRYTAYVADYETEHTSVTDKTSALVAVPESYLIGNYPNPFNPSTTINFVVAPEDVGKVKLIKIYNIMGQLVAVIDVSSFAAGQHSVRFDGVDYFGNPLPSGHYFVRLHVGDQVSTLRMTLEK